MSNRIWYIYIVIFTFYSCDYFVLNKKENRDEIRKEEWNKLKQQEVEEPPLFKICEHKSTADLKQCFENTVTTHISRYINNKTIHVEESIQDTLWLSLLVTNNGNILIEKFRVPNFLEDQESNFRTLIEKSITSLPLVAPAHIRGIPVNSRYKLPIVLHAD